MVHSLHTSGANAIWEHQLLEPGKAAGRRKPSARDSLHPVKSEFIRAKHQNLAFVHRVAKEGEQPTQEDLSKQLHASVRTANLETSLRLLAQGALPSHLHPDKGSTALHVAARSGQACQVELLLVYGADPTAKDSQGMTPADCARDAGYLDLEARLIESQYEVTDRLAHHLSGRNPEHHLGQHFILPEMADCLDLSAHARAAKQKLQSLPERLFVELARDLYDEVDRRECEAVWLGANLDRQAVPFLPVSPELSSTRNQARQKLARLTAREFATLLIDVLSEAKRRHLGTKQPVSEDQRLSDDEPLYDSVASDEDNHISRQLWQRMNDLQREHAAMRLDLEAMQATLVQARHSNRGTSSPQAQRSPRPQSMCEWRHLAGATSRTGVHEIRLSANISGGAGSDRAHHALHPQVTGMCTRWKPRCISTLHTEHFAGSVGHEHSLWWTAYRHSKQCSSTSGGQCTPAAVVGIQWPRRVPAHPGGLRGGQGGQGARPGVSCFTCMCSIKFCLKSKRTFSNTC
ncbi:ARF GTPase-activating protein GIT2 isoform X2 [Rhipicephalus sanguineus]|uniref:ARF GTPase-activating protein GIT2 isoform X2 n=1 Tax=Rhipicephalus sanguineus TaxID=34632 RepID=UPI0020C4CA94|nr:ARF GTPase-activating protein GIT2 isoform X2 [Rhipicephalus sanguineus]